MKNTHTFIGFMLISIFAIQPAFAQKKKTFQGTLVFTISYKGNNITAAEKMMLSTSINASVKDCKLKTEMSQGPITQTIITDGVAKTETMLIDYNGEKKSIKLNETEIKSTLPDKFPTVNIPERKNSFLEIPANRS